MLYEVITVRKKGSYGDEVACPHPILPVERLVNIDTGEEKLRIAYSKGRRWRSIIVDKNTLASTQSITKLAIWGIAVNSENAKNLIKYLADIENINYDVIPEYVITSYSIHYTKLYDSCCSAGRLMFPPE